MRLMEGELKAFYFKDFGGRAFLSLRDCLMITDYFLIHLAFAFPFL